MRIDLHSHSTASDGTFSPSQLLCLAKQAGIETFAITDHDTMAGYLAVATMAEQMTKNQTDDRDADGNCDKGDDKVDDTFRLIAGVEISCHHTLTGGYGKHQTLDKIIHVVGLDIKEVQTMQARLTDIQQSRANRGYQIADKVAQLFGLDVDEFWQKCLEQASGNALGLGRAHIAGAMVALGLGKTYQEAFDKYLGDGKCAYVPIDAWSMADTIDLIHQCGGLAVLAHPTRYHLSATRVRRLIEAFAQLGGDGCELPSADEPISTRQMVDRAISEHQLLVSVGSDFHGTTMPWRKLGRVAKLHVHQVGIWTKFC